MLLLASRLGLRVGDLRRLRLDDLDWEASTITIAQAKTGAALTLPVSEEVGEALIDYLRFGRPAVAHRVRWSRKNGQSPKVYSTEEGGIRDEHKATVQHGVQGEGSAEALRGDQTIQENAARHKMHPNQVSVRKQLAVAGMKEVFSNGAQCTRGDHEAEIRDLHAKIGELTVEQDFLARGLKR